MEYGEALSERLQAVKRLMKIGTSSLLGLAIGDREFACVQVAGRGARRPGARAARLDVPANVSLEDPEALGRLLRGFLDEHRMSAKRAVVGVPARWLIAEPRELPPTSREQALASLRLQAERIGLGDESHLIFDAAGRFGNQQPGQVLLVALSGDRLDRLKRMCAAAGITPIAVTATGLVVAQSLKGTVEQAVILFSGEGAELVWRSERGPRAFRHLSGVRAGATTAAGAASGIQPLTTELWRAVAMSASAAGAARAGGPSTAEGGGGIERIILLGDAGVSDQQCSELAGRLGRAVDCMPGLTALRHLPAAESLNGQSDRVAAERIWPALALAGAVARGVDELPVNFLRPKLALPKPARVNRKWATGLAAIFLVALGIAGLWWWTTAAETTMTRLEAQLQSKQHDIQQAQEYVASVSYARGFFETRPPVLECLRDLAQTFGREERIWTTTYSMRENGRGQLQGRAADQQTVMALADRLKEHPNFAEVRLTDMREAASGGRSRGTEEIGFTMTFVYVPRDNAQEARP